MSTNPYPVREPAPGPSIVLDLPRLWAAVEREMDRRGLTEMKQLSELVGIDRNTLGRARRRARAGEIAAGQRGGLNVNAYLTLAAFANNGYRTEYGRELRNIPRHTTGEPSPEESHQAILAE